MSAAKKGNNKSAAAATYAYRDIVLGKVRGYQPWPGMVIDPDTAPPAVAAERPSKGGKSHYCVKFFPKGDHAWLPPSSLSRLQPHEINAFIDEPPKGQQNKKDLLEGYKIARDPSKWEEEQAELAANAAEELADADVDELEDGSEGSADSKPAKKRKRASEGGGRAKKVERSAAESGSALPKKRAPRKSNGKKSKDTIESEDDAERADADGEADDAGPSKAQPSPPPAKKTKHNKDDGPLADDKEAQKVKNWRHTLQKTFLTNTSGAKAEDIPVSDALFTEIEQYNGMTVAYLSYSKIGKVMRHIHLLDEAKIPDEATYGFRKRAKALVDKWQTQLHSTAGAPSPTVEKPKEDGAPEKKDGEEKGEEKAKEDEVVKENGSATAAEGEKKDEVVVGDGDAKMEDATAAPAEAGDAPAEPAAAPAEGDVAMAEA
ncbi:unnamed protein product [Peniophora sp. CBMAI 1063]|nr:unnamed protein product [Peniophora sp. CBMAI 1063]